MYLETIDEKAFRSFLSNPAISVLDGNVLDKNKVISAWAIAPRKLSDEVKEFLAENCAGYSKYWSDIPMKTVSRIESGRKVLWKNPCFEGDRK